MIGLSERNPNVSQGVICTQTHGATSEIFLALTNSLIASIHLLCSLQLLLPLTCFTDIYLHDQPLTFY